MRKRKKLQINKSSTQDHDGLQVETAGRCLCYGTLQTHGAQLQGFTELTNWAKILDYIFYTGCGGQRWRRCVRGVCQPFHFWMSLEITECLLVAPRGELSCPLRRLITVKSNLLLIINLWKLNAENKRSKFMLKHSKLATTDNCVPWELEKFITSTASAAARGSSRQHGNLILLWCHRRHWPLVRLVTTPPVWCVCHPLPCFLSARVWKVWRCICLTRGCKQKAR